MSQMPLPHDPVDDVLSDYFKSAMPKAWPAAPRTAEPSITISARSSASGNRARFTLAASVAIALGLGLYFANGPQPAARPAPGKPALLPDGSAKMPKEFEKPKEPMLN
ncbi:MAG: hypothetical protein U0791_19275 [Gemmataceae bacterium]